MAEDRERKKLIARALAMRKALKTSYQLRGRLVAKAGRERKIAIAQRTVRVLEYGFDDPGILPLYIDLHGGGFILMNADDDEVMNLTLQNDTGVKVISVEYPLAPENPWPAAAEAVYEVARHYIENARQYGIDPHRVGIGGHSAGGNLATVACLLAKKRGEDLFRLQILDYPPLDLAADPFAKPLPRGSIKPKTAAMFNACYAASEEMADPHVSPLYAGPDQLAGLPPALVIVAGRDSLHDEGVRYAQMLREAGVEVELREFAGEPHGFTYNSSPATDEALDAMGDFILRHMGGL